MCKFSHGRHNHVVFRKLALESRALFVGVEISAGSSSVGASLYSRRSSTNHSYQVRKKRHAYYAATTSLRIR